VINIS